LAMERAKQTMGCPYESRPAPISCCSCQHRGHNSRETCVGANPTTAATSETLLEAAIHLIGEVGPTAFTSREVARRAGVSHNAPYRHFRDKDDLLAAVATEGFRELTKTMVEAAARQSGALDRLKHAGPISRYDCILISRKKCDVP
jgi:hypothetical protein